MFTPFAEIIKLLLIYTLCSKLATTQRIHIRMQKGKNKAKLRTFDRQCTNLCETHENNS